jgi:hypothetical protein
MNIPVCLNSCRRIPKQGGCLWFGIVDYASVQTLSALIWPSEHRSNYVWQYGVIRQGSEHVICEEPSIFDEIDKAAHFGRKTLPYE